jgi:hypothetical protein
MAGDRRRPVRLWKVVVDNNFLFFDRRKRFVRVLLCANRALTEKPYEFPNPL